MMPEWLVHTLYVLVGVLLVAVPLLTGRWLARVSEEYEEAEDNPMGYGPAVHLTSRGVSYVEPGELVRSQAFRDQVARTLAATATPTPNSAGTDG